MNIENESDRDTLMDWLGAHAAPVLFKHVHWLFSQYDTLTGELEQDGNLNKYAACVDCLQTQLNKLLERTGWTPFETPRTASRLFVHNTTIH